MDRISSEQSRILDGFRRFHARTRRLPSAAEAQASAARRPAEIVSYREVMAAFSGRTWREVRTLATSRLGLDLDAVTRRRDAVLAPAESQPATPVAGKRPAPAAARPVDSVTEFPLSDAQFELLWEVSLAPHPADELDRRTLRALVSRGLATVEGEWLCGTDRARPAVLEHLQSCAMASSSGRITALFRALVVLEETLPIGAEVSLGTAFASADDVALGFYRKARAMRR